MKTRTVFSAILMVLFITAGSAYAYINVIDLGSLDGYPTSYAWSINNNNRIVGWVENESGDSRACVFDSSGGGVNTGMGSSMSGFSSGAFSSNSDQIVGQITESTLAMTPGNSIACIFGSTTLGTLGGDDSSAQSINADGQIVGWAQNSSGCKHSCIFDATGGGANTDLGTLGGHISEATSNNSNKIVGYADNSSNYERACIFDSTGGGANIDLGTLGGDSSMAWSINSSDEIVGWALDDAINYRACLFDSTGGGNNIDLGTLGGNNSEAYAINDAGQIVGYSLNSEDDYIACLFDATGGGNNIDLNTLIDPASGWILMYAFDINNNGWIVGSGMYNGQIHAFLLVPEPATIVFLTFGGFAVRFRRQKNIKIKGC